MPNRQMLPFFLYVSLLKQSLLRLSRDCIEIRLGRRNSGLTKPEGDVMKHLVNLLSSCGIEYSKISVRHSYVTVITGTPPVCYSKNGSNSDGGYGYYLENPFSLSSHRNKFVAIGCDIYASIQGESDDSMPPTTGCASFCDNLNKSNISAGRGYCETALPRTIHSFDIGVYSVNTEKRAWTKGLCNLAFIVDKKFSKFDSQIDRISSHSDWENKKYGIPLVLDWGIGNISCHQARKSKDYLCSQNAECRDINAAGGGYNCYCKQGYQGNPYVYNGCKDVDECKDLTNNKCKTNAMCNNTPGSYNCTCPTGYYSSYNLAEDGWRCIPGQGHQSSSTFLLLGVGIFIGVLILIAFGFWLYWHLKRLKKIRIKQKFFKRNGGLLFQQQISSSEGSVKKIKLFAVEELEKATDNFNQSRVLGKGGVGTVYKGMLQDGSIVAVKKSNMMNKNQIGQFINEVSILVQIDHRNIVKLLGCCLETDVPLLVYEYVSNGTLSHHLHEEGCVSISWENRLRISKEVAGALAYLHSYASTSIFHRDIKSSNILLDENFRAVVSDFGLSRSASTEKTHLTTVVGGTFGYLDPEYFRSGQFTDKSDVYAFGVVLAEVLTGVKAVSLDVSKLGLVMYFQSFMKQNRLFEILDPLVVEEGVKEDILVVAKLAKRCLKLNAKKRPSMREVVADLDRLTGKQIQPSHELICRDNYLSGSECSYSFATDGINEDCSNPVLVFPKHAA